MNSQNDKEEKKGGFWSALSGLFRGGSSAMGGASSGLGSAGGIGGLFATKAGILGVVLGGATIAAGVGVIYNFVGSSSKSVYTPQLFQNSYLEEESQKAGMERANRNSASGDISSLDMFREQAKKDGLGGSPDGAGDKSGKDASADASAEAPAVDNNYAAGASGADAAGAGAPKLQAAPGFGSKGGGGGGGASGTTIPRMQDGGGLSSGIGNQFASVYRPPAGTGKSSAMNGSLASRVGNSPKYTVPNFNKKGAFGQAKYAGKMGSKAAYSTNASGSRTEASQPFDGGNTGTGDAGAAGTGAGLGGAGVSAGAGLKGNDPSLNSNNSTPPKVSDPVNDDSEVKKWTDRAMYGMLLAAALIFATSIFAKKANAALHQAAVDSAAGPVGMAKVAGDMATYASMKSYAMYCCIAACVAAGFVMIAGMKLRGLDQKMTGMIYMGVGAILMYQAYAAYSGIGEGGTAAQDISTLTGNGNAEFTNFAATNNINLSSIGGSANAAVAP
ncbi:MAG: hypothetical protein NTX59_13920 [Elusimicrobia bacterium]|nr:hypothetical protein [Elusimicrobiota bacterium]